MSQVIPEAAVEAAAKVIESRTVGLTLLPDLARAALEAAKPYMVNPAPAIMEGPSDGADAVTGFPRAAYRKRRMG